MRRKPSSPNGGGYNNQHKKPRFQHGGSGGHSQGGGGGGNRPRRNYPAMREKYLAQARDALAAGDRVLAENYFQHADHAYRMMMEEGSHRPRPQNPQQQGDGQQGHEGQNNENSGSEEFSNDSENVPNASVLPAFLTVNYEKPADGAEPVIAPNWEENQ
jgi:hypothetical protein